MRLWHQSLIPHLPRQQLLGQHRECCALRGNGWGRKHSVVDYVFTHTPDYLVAYHYLIIEEMIKREYKPDKIWNNPNWRGSTLGNQDNWANLKNIEILICQSIVANENIYPEHNQEYLQECLDNLKSKGIEINLN